MGDTLGPEIAVGELGGQAWVVLTKLEDELLSNGSSEVAIFAPGADGKVIPIATWQASGSSLRRAQIIGNQLVVAGTLPDGTGKPQGVSVDVLELDPPSEGVPAQLRKVWGTAAREGYYLVDFAVGFGNIR